MSQRITKIKTVKISFISNFLENKYYQASNLTLNILSIFSLKTIQENIKTNVTDKTANVETNTDHI